MPQLLRDGAPVYGVSLPGQWLDIGTVGDYYRVIQLALRGGVHGVALPGSEIAPGVRVGLNVRIDPVACHLTPPICLAGSCSVEPGATIIGPAWIGSGCVIEGGAVVEKSVVMDYTRVGPAAHLHQMIVCGGYCVNAEESVVDLEQSDIRWVIADARSPKIPLRAEQQELLDLLQRLREEG